MRIQHVILDIRCLLFIGMDLCITRPQSSAYIFTLHTVRTIPIFTYQPITTTQMRRDMSVRQKFNPWVFNRLEQILKILFCLLIWEIAFVVYDYNYLIIFKKLFLHIYHRT